MIIVSKEEVMRRIKEANVDMIMLDEYKGHVRDYHRFKCNKCEGIWERRLDHVFEGRGCPKCNFSIKHDIKTINENVSKYEVEIYGEYVNNFAYTNWKCKKCGGIFSCGYDVLRDGRKFCPHCSPKFYKNEKITGEYLKEIFPNICINKNYKINEKIEIKGKLIRNFVIVDYYFEIGGVKIVVEFNGHQHYKPCRFWDRTTKEAEKKYEEQQIRDKWLVEYCNNKNIRLVNIDGRRIYNSKIKNYLENIFSNITPCNSKDILSTH
jgi:hypothetical protein